MLYFSKNILLRAGYGIWLYQFLIIAYLFTLFYPQTFMPGLWIKTLFCFFCPFGILIALLGEEGAGLCVCRAFVCYLCTGWSVSLFLFLLVLGLAVTSTCGSSCTFLFTFLAHLSRRLTRWAYSIPMVRRPSVVVRRPSSSTLSNMNISEASGPILITFYV